MQGRYRNLRRLAACSGLVAVVLAGVTTTQGSEALERTLVVVSTGGAFDRAMKEHFFDPFAKATGVTVRVVTANDAEQWTKVKAMAQVGKTEWDIVSGSNATIPTHREYLATLNCKALPNAASQGMPGACQEHGLLRTIGGVAIAYNTEAFPEGRRPRNWSDFYDVERFPGPRALPNIGAPWSVIVPALLADGVSPDALFPLDLDRAFRKLDKLRPHVKVWWKSGDQSQQIMRDKEVVLSQMWSGRALSLKSSGFPIDVEWNQAIKDLGYWVVLKDAPHPKTAIAFLNFFMERPEAHVAFSRQIFYGTASRRALEFVPVNDRTTRALFEPKLETMVDVAADPWIAANRDRILERWNAWLAQ